MHTHRKPQKPSYHQPIVEFRLQANKMKLYRQNARTRLLNQPDGSICKLYQNRTPLSNSQCVLTCFFRILCTPCSRPFCLPSRAYARRSFAKQRETNCEAKLDHETRETRGGLPSRKGSHHSTHQIYGRTGQRLQYAWHD